MVLARQTKISVLNRSAIKSLRTILQEDFFESIQSFLDKTSELHSQLHEFIETDQSLLAKKLCQQFSDSCDYIGAEKLSVKLLELINKITKNQTEEMKDLLVQIDQLYDLTRVELQMEFSKPVKKAV